jgi:CheY-like chemotaxis protein
MPHILVVDDDPALLALTQKILSDAGHSVDTAANGAEALAILESKPAYDLVVTDLYMPIMAGLELLTLIRQTFPGTPIISMSGGDDFGRLDDLARAGILGAEETLYKPFDRGDLLAAVERCLHKEPL